MATAAGHGITMGTATDVTAAAADGGMADGSRGAVRAGNGTPCPAAGFGPAIDGVARLAPSKSLRARDHGSASNALADIDHSSPFLSSYCAVPSQSFVQPVNASELCRLGIGSA